MGLLYFYSEILTLKQSDASLRVGLRPRMFFFLAQSRGLISRSACDVIDDAASAMNLMQSPNDPRYRLRTYEVVSALCIQFTCPPGGCVWDYSRYHPFLRRSSQRGRLCRGNDERWAETSETS